MQLYVDTTAQALVVGPSDTRRTLASAITAGDTVPISLAFLQRNPAPLNTGAPVYQYIDMSAQGIILSVGSGEVLPTAGSFTLTFGANTTPPLNWNVDRLSLSAALNALASIVAAGGVTVAGNVGGPFSVSFNNAGFQSSISCGTNSLFPSCTVSIASAQGGTSSLSSVQVITLAQSPAAQISSWTAQPSAAITVTPISGPGYQRVSIPAGTYGGSFTLTYGASTTSAIPWNAQLDVVQAALTAIGITGVTVWPGQNYWDITSSASSAFVGNAAGLIVPLILTGSLNLVGQDIFSLVDGGSVSVPLLIQSTANGSTQTIFSDSILIEPQPFGVPTATIPIVPAYQEGQIPLVSGQQSYAITFPIPFGSAPRIVSLQLVMPNSSGESFVVTYDGSSLTGSGLTAWLDGIPSALSTGGFIKWFAIL